MQSIDKYIFERSSKKPINERLSLNSQSKLQTKININIDKTTNFTNDEINTIIEFFDNYNIKPYDISNMLYTKYESGGLSSKYLNYASVRVQNILVHYKSIYTENDNDDLHDSCIYFTKHKNNDNIRLSASWHSSTDKHNEHKVYLSYVPLNEIIKDRLPKLLKHKDFIKSLKK